MTLYHKYHAIRTEVDGKKFPSKKEARRYQELKVMQKTGRIIFFIRQAPFDLPGGVTYRADFMIFWSNGTVTIEDTKGVDTPVSSIKRKQVEELYPVKIEVI